MTFFLHRDSFFERLTWENLFVSERDTKSKVLGETKRGLGETFESVKTEVEIRRFWFDCCCFHNLFIIRTSRPTKTKVPVLIFSRKLFPNDFWGLIFEDPKPEIPGKPWCQRKMESNLGWHRSGDRFVNYFHRFAMNNRIEIGGATSTLPIYFTLDFWIPLIWKWIFWNIYAAR